MNNALMRTKSNSLWMTTENFRNDQYEYSTYISMNKLYAFKCVAWSIVLVPFFVLAIAITTVVRTATRHGWIVNLETNLASAQKYPGGHLDLTKEKDFFGSVPALRTSATGSCDMYEIGITRYIYRVIKTPGKKSQREIYRCCKRDVPSMISLTIEERGGNVARFALSEIN